LIFDLVGGMAKLSEAISVNFEHNCSPFSGENLTDIYEISSVTAGLWIKEDGVIPGDDSNFYNIFIADFQIQNLLSPQSNNVLQWYKVIDYFKKRIGYMYLDLSLRVIDQ
jgi:hypothetical protein